MFGSTLLDVAIGMMFVYLLVSLICSAANEAIEGWLKNRAKDLERGLRSLLSSEAGTGPIDLVAKLYEHPLIAGLFRGSYSDSVKVLRSNILSSVQRVFKGPSLPSYIPARSFALALMDTVLPAITGNAPVASGATGSDERSAPPVNAPPFDPLNPLSALRSAVGSSTVLNPLTKVALLPLIDAAGNDVQKARENIEQWFNAAMDRVSGWYKRRTQAFLLILGLLVASVLNIDSIAIIKHLSTDKALRDEIATTAKDFVKANPAQGSSTAAADSSQPDLSELTKKVQLINSLGLPIGWQAGSSGMGSFDIKHASGSEWLLKILGLLITGLAASLGAPFWFDMLNKLIVVRSTAKPGEKSSKEGIKK